MICMLDFDRGLNNAMLISFTKHRIETSYSFPFLIHSNNTMEQTKKDPNKYIYLFCISCFVKMAAVLLI